MGKARVNRASQVRHGLPSFRRTKRGQKGQLRLGLTGSIASGKTTVLSLFRRAGFHAISSDAIVASIYKKWGLTKQKLRAHVAGSERRLRALEKRVHPVVESEIFRLFRENAKKPIVVEVPLLFEAKFDRHFYRNIFVYAHKEHRAKRAVQRKMPLGLFYFLEKKQWSASKKAAKADYILHNSGTRLSLQKQVKGLIAFLKSKSH